MAKFKTNLKRLMLEKSVILGYPLTQKELSESTGLSVPTISRWYQGSVDRIEITTVEPLINYLGCQFTELVEYEMTEHICVAYEERTDLPRTIHVITQEKWRRWNFTRPDLEAKGIFTTLLEIRTDGVDAPEIHAVLVTNHQTYDEILKAEITEAIVRWLVENAYMPRDIRGWKYE